jgi:hypothetical protein
LLDRFSSVIYHGSMARKNTKQVQYAARLTASEAARVQAAADRLHDSNKSALIRAALRAYLATAESGGAGGSSLPGGSSGDLPQ